MDNKPFLQISRWIKEKTSDSIDDRIYYVCLCAIIVLFNVTCSSIMLENITTVYRYVRLARYAVLLIMMFNGFVIGGEYTVRELLIYISVTVYLTVVTINAEEKNILFSLIVIMSSKGRSLDRIARVYLYTYIVITVIVITLYFTGIIPDFTMYRDDGMIRHSLGFNHPNLLGMFLFTIVLSYLVAYPKEHQGILFYIIVLFFTVFIYIVPNSRTAALCMIVLLIAHLLRNLLFWKTKIGQIMLICVPLLFCIISILGSLFFSTESKFMVLLDKLVTGRISLAYAVIVKAGLPGLWGNNLSHVGYPVDNSYCRMLLFYGIPVILMFMSAYIYAIHRVYSKGRIDLVMYLLVFAFYGLSEVFMLCVMYNIMLMAITADIPDNNKQVLIKSDPEPLLIT